MNAAVSKIDESSWDEEPVAVQVDRVQPFSPPSNRSRKMWKPSSFSSQSSGPDVDLFEIDWDLCFICQIDQVCGTIFLTNKIQD